jgi:2'-5' RNA ligase
MRLVAAAKMHVTLHFLGELTVPQVESLRAALAAAIVQPSFHMQLKGGGCFPSARRPRVLWIGAREQDWPQFEQLMGQIGQALGAAGLPTKLEDDFHPHVTIGRARAQKVPGVKKAIEELDRVQWPAVQVDRIRLWRSDHQRTSAPELRSFPQDSWA